MLEMAGVPYTGADPLGHAVSLDKVTAKVLLRDAGIATPAFAVLRAPGESADELRYPLVVKPRHESTSCGLHLVNTPSRLEEAVASVVADYQQEALVEEYVDGREVCIGVLGNEPPILLPPVELDFGARGLRLMTWEDKYHRRVDEPKKICPAALSADQVELVNTLARETFRACHARDYARVDIRFDAAGNPNVLEINSMASLGLGGSYVHAACSAGLSFDELVGRIVDAAYRRYFGVCAPRSEASEDPVMAGAA